MRGQAIACPRKYLPRRQLGLSRRVVANLVGRSEEWLRQVERGQRKLDSIEVLTHLARVLHIDDLTEFLGWRDDENTRNEPNCGPLTERLRDVLMQPLFMAEPARTPPVPRLCMELDHLLATWRESARRYTVVANLLPCLLKRLRAVAKSGERTPELSAALTQAYGLACAFADRMNDHHLAWIAADLCVDVAVDAEDPVLIRDASDDVARYRMLETISWSRRRAGTRQPEVRFGLRPVRR
ncbi:helix-turn-helix domain-containing protein [Kibdelosporangium aridum]|uniref:helix-turn-helix domain-containing protein n=1 Tax=Kibdelosporangium aridum TaxID=2030 RepID=UPI00135A8048|nr:helix-turn-helix transcriptional regulator [Kibdelosporangium aridum]